jgi:predicted permease
MIARLRSLFRNLFRRGRLEQSLDDEVRACLDVLIQQRLAQGVAPAEARRQALVELGGIEPIREQVRATRSGALLESLAGDLRFGLRRLRYAPGFTVVAVVTLALGIGLNTLMFSFTNAVLLKPLPFPAAERLVRVSMAPTDNPGAVMMLTPPMYFLLRQHSLSFEAVGAYSGPRLMNLGGDGELAPAERLRAHQISVPALEAFAVKPLLGRFHFPDEEVTPGVSNTLLLGHSLWMRRFDGRTDVLGQIVTVEGLPTTIVGVMPPEFEVFDGAKDAWLSFPFRPAAAARGSAHWLEVVGRLKPGLSIEQAMEETRAAAMEYTATFPERGPGWRILLEPLDRAVVGGYRDWLLMLQTAVGFVLLISCVNLAALLLTRAAGREREIAVRTALGQSRAGLVRQALVESVLLSLAGGTLGGFLAWLAVKPLLLVMPQFAPRLDAVGFDVRVFTFLLLACLVAGVVFGLAPAWRASRPNLAAALFEAGGRSSAGRSRLLQLHGLVTLQVALAFVLLIGAGLLIGTFVRLLNVDMGVDPSGMLSLQVQLPRSQYGSEEVARAEGGGVTLVDYYPSGPIMFDRIHQTLSLLPGVEHAAAIGQPPFTGTSFVEYTLEGGEGSRRASGSVAFVTPNYFKAMKMRLLRGRDFNDSDQRESPWLIVINEAMARAEWKEHDPIGKRLTFSYYAGDGERPREVIGVVADTRLSRTEESARPMIYALHRQQQIRQRASVSGQRMQMSYVVRTSGDPMLLAKPAQQAIARIDAAIPVTEIRTVDSYLDDQVETERFLATVFGVLAGIALLIGTVGIYGVTGHAVMQRYREFGIRRALGASGGAVLRLVLRRVLVVVGVGTVFGVGASLALTTFIETYLWGVEPNDVSTFVGIGTLLATAALVASFVPALRAARVDPLAVLRHE